MEIKITSTHKLTSMDGVKVRLWEGVTAAGVPCKVYVHRVAFKTDNDMAEFERDLKERLPPVEYVPLTQTL